MKTTKQISLVKKKKILSDEERNFRLTFSNNMIIGRQKKNNMSQDSLSIIAGMGLTTIKRYESGKSSQDYYKASRIGRILGFSIDQFYSKIGS